MHESLKRDNKENDATKKIQNNKEEMKYLI